MHVAAQAIRPRLRILAQAPVPTNYGQFEMVVFRYEEEENSADAGLSPDHVALVRGDLHGRDDVTVRVHSECLTSEVFGSLKCDCKLQLEAAQKEIARQELGVVLYLRQEGRGIGLANKIRAYELQARGADTVDANRMLSLPDDARGYGAAAAMLEHLGVRSVRLMTNNPLKVDGLMKHGIDVRGRKPAIVSPNEFSMDYLQAKRLRMGHELPDWEDTTRSPTWGDAE